MSAGAYPFGAVPISALLEADDPSTADPVGVLALDPRAELAYIMRAKVVDRDRAWGGDYDEEDVYLSSSGYTTLGDGAGADEGIPDHQLFVDCLSTPYSVKVNLIPSGSWQASALPGFGSITISNADGRLSHLLKKNWEWRELTVWVGRRQWYGPTFSQFGKIFRGTVESVTADLSSITLNVRDLRDLMARDVNPEAYLGFGVGVRLRADGDLVRVPYDAALATTDGTDPVLSFEVMVCPEAPMRQGVIGGKDGLDGWLLVMFADGAVGLFDRGLENRVTTASGLLEPAVPRRVGAYGDQSGLRIVVDGEVVASNSTPYGAPDGHGDLVVGSL